MATDKETAAVWRPTLVEVAIIGMFMVVYTWAGFEPFVVLTLTVLLLNQLRGGSS